MTKCVLRTNGRQPKLLRAQALPGPVKALVRKLSAKGQLANCLMEPRIGAQTV